MHETLTVQLLVHAHLAALALWLGGLFGYVVIVWPAVVHDAGSRFPRALLAGIAMRTGPWIYAAMALALVTYAALIVNGSVAAHPAWIAVYGLLLASLVGNNAYGSMVAWPRMMLLPAAMAGQSWFWFRLRMTAALVIGLALYVAAVYCILSGR
jgi:uncharacterized membrane protein